MQQRRAESEEVFRLALTESRYASRQEFAAMNHLDPIHGAEVPAWRSIYVIGSYDSRITFFSQQVRGFTLASALVAAGALRNKRRFAVIGAGAAGLSVAAGLSLLKPDCHVDVLEREEHPLHLQRGCVQRDLRPHIYDWPRPGARNERADLPFLDWEAGTADSVASTVMRQFGILQAYRPGSLTIKSLCDVTAIERVDPNAYRVWCRQGRDTDPSSATYDAVFIAIGFGRERRMENAPWHSYWSDAGVPSGPRYAERETTVLISGSGDGGLIDLCAAALQDFNHTALIELVTTWPGIDGIAEELLQIDLEAEQFGNGFDFIAAYDREVGPRLRRDGLIGDIAGRLRHRVRIVFNTKREQRLEQPTSILNRLMVYLLFAAARDAGVPIQHLPGEVSADAARPGTYLVAGTHIEPDEVFVRHGAARSDAFAPFQEICVAYETNHEQWLAADPKRCSPPHMNPEAVQALEAALADANMPIPRHLHAVALALQPAKVRVGMADRPPAIIWSGCVQPGELLAWWGNNPDRVLHLECAARPSELANLAGAIARFVIHARQLRFESDDPHWVDWLTTLTQKSLHTHAMQYPVTGPTVPARMPSVKIDHDAVAAELHRIMDRWTLERVDGHLRGYFATGSEPARWITWKIDKALRTDMARRWADWRPRLEADPALLSRLFRLAACTVEDDHGDIVDRQVLVGPAKLPNIIRTITLALAAAQAWPIAAPRNVAPGNFDRRADDGTEIATIHASGADLIDGQNLTVMVSQHAWQTTFILLSELTASAGFEQASQLSFADTRMGLLRLDTPPMPRNVILGADAVFQRALATGAGAVAEHLATAEARLWDEWKTQIDTTEVQA